MGRHTASRASLPAALASAARRGAHGAARVAPRRRRTLGTGAAVAAVALTATTAAAAFADGSAPSAQTTSPSAEQAGSPSATTTAAGTAPATLGAVTADPATVEAASDALVRAQFLTGEGASSLTPEQIAQIEDARTRLSTAVTAASPADGSSELADLPALAGSGLADAADDAAADTTTESESESEGDTATGDAEEGALLTTADTLDASVPGLTERGSDRASRSSARASLDDLAAVPPLEATVPDLAEPSDDTATAATPDAAASADASTESPEEDAAAADSATAAPDLATGATDDATAPVADASPAGAPTSDEIASLTAELSTLLDAAGSGVTVEVVPGPPSAAEIAAQLDKWAASTAGYGNGQIPASALCELSFAPGEQLRCDAAHQIEALNEKFREAFGVNLSVTDSYRSYASQVAVKASRGYFAAPPGMSNHGWALALDLGGGIQGYGTAQYEWMRANAPAYGWDNPEWARAGGSKNEPWHWEYGDLS
jgi:hypothetical protein